MAGADDKYDVPPEKWHVTLVEMMDAVTTAFVSGGKPAPQAEADAGIAVKAIYKTFRGSQLYIPISAAAERAMLHARIFAEFDGKNQSELSRRYDTTVQNIYRIIKKQREIKRIARGDENE